MEKNAAAKFAEKIHGPTCSSFLPAPNWMNQMERAAADKAPIQPATAVKCSFPQDLRVEKQLVFIGLCFHFPAQPLRQQGVLQGG